MSADLAASTTIETISIAGGAAPAQKTWRQGYGWEGVRQSFTIGCAARVQLADAGKIARQVQGWLKDGIDPHSRRSAGGACENGW